MTSLAITNATASTPGKATFNGKANIQDITNPMFPISVAGNATLQVTMTDMGEPGKYDKIAITLWNGDGGLWFANNFDGSKTCEQRLDGGNLKVHGSTFVTGNSVTTVGVTSSKNPSVVGEQVTFTATVTGSTTAKPTGSVSFIDAFDGKTLATVPLPSTGIVTVATAVLKQGSHEITAYYGGDSKYSSNASVIIQTVGAAPVTYTNTTVGINADVAEVTDTKFGLTAFPNPTQNQFKVHVESSNRNDKIMLRVYDAYGRTVRLIRDAMAGQTITLGNEYRPGIYYIEMIQGKNRQQVKLLKVVY